MDESPEEAFVTIIPKNEADYEVSREMLEAHGLPADRQTQFAGKAALESAVAFTRDGIAIVAKISRKLLKANKIEEITIEFGEKKVVLRGVPADQSKTVIELTDHIFAHLNA